MTRGDTEIGESRGDRYRGAMARWMALRRSRGADRARERRGAPGPHHLAPVAAERGPDRPRLRRHLPGAREGAVPLRRGAPQRRRHARPVPRRGERAGHAGAVARRPAHRGAGPRRRAAGGGAAPGRRAGRPDGVRGGGDPRALALLHRRALRARGPGRADARVEQDRLLPVRLLRHQRGRGVVPARPRLVLRARRAPGVRADGSLPGRGRSLRVAAGVPVRRHHRPGAGELSAARRRQPRRSRARVRRRWRTSTPRRGRSRA